MAETRPQVIRTMALGAVVYAALEDRQMASLFAALGIAVALTYVSDFRRTREAKIAGVESGARSAHR